MSPKKLKKLSKLRKKLDLIDNKMLNLVGKRGRLVERVLELKQFKNQIVDRKRINQVLRRIKKMSIQKKIDSKVSNRIWKNMIAGFIDLQRKNFKK